jgi:hypothetical protein
MANEQMKAPKPPAVWVRLHLEPQSERSTMPPFIEGKLGGETATTYQLIAVIKVFENEDTFEQEYREVPEHHHVNKTYVWDCEVLGERPVAPAYNGVGGLG